MGTWVRVTVRARMRARMKVKGNGGEYKGEDEGAGARKQLWAEITLVNKCYALML